MKIAVLKKAPIIEHKPTRGFLETKDIRASYLNGSLTKLEVTLGTEHKVYENDSPFILWSEFEMDIDAYMASKNKPKEPTNELVSKRKPTKRKAK